MFRPVKLLSGSAVVLLLVAMLTACASANNFGSLTKVDGGTQVVIPALWADSQSGASGIEPAVVWVDSTRTDSASAYEVNLNDVVAKGGGKQWQAATSSAAAVGTLFSGLDPNSVSCRFDITGPIDGPSAGGILTVAVLAALKGHDLDPSITMTGTISPDGSIGAVGSAGLKLRAAAKFGFRTVLLPASMASLEDPDSGKYVDTKSFAQELDLKVVFVDSVIDAYSLFTGEPLVPVDIDSSYSFSNYSELDAARFTSTDELLNEIAGRFEKASDVPAEFWDRFQQSRNALRASNVSLAYGLAVDTLQSFERWRGAQAFDDLVAEKGLAVARTEFLAAAQIERKNIESELDAAVDGAEKLNNSQLLSLPNALGWLTYGRAIMLSFEEALTMDAAENDDDTLRHYAALAYQVAAEAEVLFPQTMTVLAAIPGYTGSASPASAETVSSFMSGYTSFLVSAGNAHLEYLRDVLGVGDDSNARVTDLLPVARILAEEARLIDAAAESPSAQLKNSATALSFYITATTLVASLQIAEDPEIWLDPENDHRQDADFFIPSVSVGYDLTRDIADELVPEDLNAGLPLWSAEWAVSVLEALSDSGRSVVGASIALNEIWYDAVTVLSMRGFINSTSSGQQK